MLTDPVPSRVGERSALLEGYHVVADLDVGHAVADRLDDAGALVSEDHGEGTLGVLAGEGVCICGAAPGLWLAIKVPG